MREAQEILVIKLGGGDGLDMPRACMDLAAIARVRPLVIVHGVSGMMAQLSAERNLPIKMLTSPSGHRSRYTDAVTRELYVEAVERANRGVLQLLRAHNIRALGMTEDVIIQGQRKRAIRAIINGRTRIIRDDYSGTITLVDAMRIRDLLDDGIVPVIPPMAASPDGLLNIDGDRASAAVASALNAEELVILSNVRGLYRNFPDEASVVSEVTGHELSRAMQWAQGRMKRKVLGAQEAIEGGVNRVVIGDGRIPNPVTQALQGAGTVFRC